MKRTYYFPKFKNIATLQDLKQQEAIHRKKAREAKAEAENETALADDLLREQNFRNIPEAKKAYENLTKIRAILKKHMTGKETLSKTRLVKVKRAEETLTKALEGLLLYGGYLKR